MNLPLKFWLYVYNACVIMESFIIILSEIQKNKIQLDVFN